MCIENACPENNASLKRRVSNKGVSTKVNLPKHAFSKIVFPNVSVCKKVCLQQGTAISPASLYIKLLFAHVHDRVYRHASILLSMRVSASVKRTNTDAVSAKRVRHHIRNIHCDTYVNARAIAQMLIHMYGLRR